MDENTPSRHLHDASDSSPEKECLPSSPKQPSIQKQSNDCISADSSLSETSEEANNSPLECVTIPLKQSKTSSKIECAESDSSSTFRTGCDEAEIQKADSEDLITGVEKYGLDTSSVAAKVTDVEQNKSESPEPPELHPLCFSPEKASSAEDNPAGKECLPSSPKQSNIQKQSNECIGVDSSLSETSEEADNSPLEYVTIPPKQSKTSSEIECAESDSSSTVRIGCDEAEIQKADSEDLITGVEKYGLDTSSAAAKVTDVEQNKSESPEPPELHPLCFSPEKASSAEDNPAGGHSACTPKEFFEDAAAKLLKSEYAHRHASHYTKELVFAIDVRQNKSESPEPPELHPLCFSPEKASSAEDNPAGAHSPCTPKDFFEHAAAELLKLEYAHRHASHYTKELVFAIDVMTLVRHLNNLEFKRIVYLTSGDIPQSPCDDTLVAALRKIWLRIKDNVNSTFESVTVNNYLQFQKLIIELARKTVQIDYEETLFLLHCVTLAQLAVWAEKQGISDAFEFVPLVICNIIQTLKDSGKLPSFFWECLLVKALLLIAGDER